MRASLSSFAVLCALALAACGGNVNTLDACSPACSAGELCDDGLCKPVPDAGAPDAGCTSDSQCSPGVCDSTAHTCVSNDCDPTCPAWETCSARTCALTPGRCDSDSDCPATAPLCDQAHSCAAPAVTPPSTLTYSALIITNQAYAPAFQQIAQLHTLTGVPTQVQTLEAICAAAPGGCSATDACNDTPKAVKDYLIAQAALGLKQVVLGGDNSIVPSRLTEALYTNTIYGADYDEIFYTDDYFGDLSEWDTNHDCVYGDDTHDTPAYIPSLGISRISISSPDELSTYFAKEQAYLTAYDTTRINTALFMSNVATDLYVPNPLSSGSTITVPVDAAFYFEAPGRTLSTIPDTYDITKLYSSIGGIWPGSSPLNDTAETAAFEQGYSLAVHSGHGDETDITVEQDGTNEFTGDMAYALQNSQYPILISCACEAATFADGETCAGEQFITAPMGGGIGYLGNSTIGLGIAGGMQLLDGFLRYTFTQNNPLIGDAILAGHVNLPQSDGLTFNNVPVIGSITLPVVDITSWRWTQKAATYLGDGLLPIYTDITTSAAPQIAVQRTAQGNFSVLRFSISAGPVGTLAVALGNDVYELPIDGSGSAVSLTVAGGGPISLTYGFSSATTLAAFQQATVQ